MGEGEGGGGQDETLWLPPPLYPLPPKGGESFVRTCLNNYGLLSNLVFLFKPFFQESIEMILMLMINIRIDNGFLKMKSKHRGSGYFADKPSRCSERNGKEG